VLGTCGLDNMEYVEKVNVAEDHAVSNKGGDIRMRTIHKKSGVIQSGSRVVTNVVYLVYGVLASMLGIRILLSLLNANRSNTFADIAYSTTNLFVRPFASLFGIDTSIGDAGSRFEIETLVAIIVYSLLASLVVRVVNIKNYREEDDINESI
jgi:hypothetical protein